MNFVNDETVIVLNDILNDLKVLSNRMLLLSCICIYIVFFIGRMMDGMGWNGTVKTNKTIKTKMKIENKKKEEARENEEEEETKKNKQIKNENLVNRIEWNGMESKPERNHHSSSL